MREAQWERHSEGGTVGDRVREAQWETQGGGHVARTAPDPLRPTASAASGDICVCSRNGDISDTRRRPRPEPPCGGLLGTSPLVVVVVLVVVFVLVEAGTWCMVIRLGARRCDQPAPGGYWLRGV